MLNFRPFNFSDEDYETLVNIHHAVWDDSRLVVEGAKRGDDTLPVPSDRWARVMAEWDGKTVGFGTLFPAFENKNANQYHVGILILPEYRKRGVGTAFWKKVEHEYLPRFQPTDLLAEARTDQPDGMRFLEKRGFAEQLRHTRTILPVETVNLTQFEGIKAKINEMGIQIQTLTTLRETDKDYQKKLWDLEWVLQQDEPKAELPERVSFEEFVKIYLESPFTYPDGWFIATDGDKYAGWCAMFPSPTRDDTVNTGITVIDRPYRRKGIATALKVETIEETLSMGRSFIETTNAVSNPMLQLNLQLGFEPVYSRVEFKKELR